MNTPLYIARRYLFSRKKHHAINIISAISAGGIALATLALVCTLSVFNGFQEMVAGMFTHFDPTLKIVATNGKVFDATDPLLQKVYALPEVIVHTETLEENAVVRYKERQAMVVIKGVEDNFEQLTQIDSILYGAGRFLLHDSVVDYAVMGAELMTSLGTGLQFVDPLEIYLPKRTGRIQLANPTASFQTAQLYSPGVVFAVNQPPYDNSYILTSLRAVRQLLEYETEASAIEIRLHETAPVKKVQQQIKHILPPDRFRVMNRYEQQADVFRIMEIEKLISYLFLTFILLIASFNIIGSLSMLMLDKRADVATLRSLGADHRFVNRVFLYEGLLISLIGSLVGLCLGLALCYLQDRYGLIGLAGGDGYFMLTAYPVSVHATDLLFIFCTVTAVGFVSVWYPVRYLSRRLMQKEAQLPSRTV